MSNTKTVMGQASNQYVTPLDITDVFSTYLYTGTGAAQTITNGIDLAGEGGLVWIKGRNAVSNHALVDTERGGANSIASDTTAAQRTDGAYGLTFNSNGFDSTGGNLNVNGREQASWTFRKAPKFFTCVTWTGDGVYGRNIPHSLDGPVGSIFIKCTTAAFDWRVWHRSLAQGADDGQMLVLNSTAAQVAAQVYAASSTNFTLTNNATVNGSGRSYVAYIFAHNDGDGGFGPDGSDIIKCGSYTGNGSTTGPEIDLGFEPQWVMIKRSDSVAGWVMFDNMRGMVVGGNDPLLQPNNSDAENTGLNAIAPQSTGFQIESAAGTYNASGGTYIYMAIRRGPLAQPESGTEVFAVDNQTESSAPFLTSGFPVDMVIRKTTTGGNSEVMSRLTQGKALFANATSSEQTDSVAQFDFNDGCLDNTGTDANRYGWMWKRSPGFCDVVAYTGNGVAGRTVSHNLGVAPEMMWVKRRDAASGEGWFVYHKDLTSAAHYLNLNSTAAESQYWNAWNSTAPTSSVFSLGNYSDVNLSSATYISYLFATLPGVSKVGSYTGNGSSQTIDCGFTSGARFVLLKDTTGGNWFVYDSVRGITSGSDPALRLNLTAAEVSTADAIAPSASGFIVQPSYFNNANDTYIFYAIA